MAETVIIQGCFQIFPNKAFYEVRLTKHKLIFEETSSNHSCCRVRSEPQNIVLLRDIYGAKLFRSCRNNDEAAYLNIFHCSIKKDKRVLEKLSFKVSGWEDVNANLKLAEKWVRIILWLVKDPGLDPAVIQEKHSLPPRRKLLVLVNPCSGKGKSLKTFQTLVAPMFDDGDLDYKLQITEYAGHAKVIGSELDVSNWDGIVICSGDGLVHEVINGLMCRPDWEAAIKMPIGVIPTGSGNALCFSALHASGEPMELMAAIYAVIKGHYYDLDIVTIVTPTDKFYSFLSLNWGIMSDVDIESEKWRYLGNARFTVGALVRIFNLRTYRGRISYLPMDEDSGVTTSIEVPRVRPMEGEELPFHSPKEVDVFQSPVGSFYSMPGSPTEERFSNFVNSCDNPGLVNSVRPSVNSVQESGGPLYSFAMPDSRLYGPSTNLLPDLNDSLPSAWKSVQGEFIFGSTAYVSHLGPDLYHAPQSKFGDGVVFVAYMKSGPSRMHLLNLFGKMEEGTHLEGEEIVCVKARAFRFEPDLSQKGTLAADGELIPYSPVQGQIHKGLGKVMCA